MNVALKITHQVMNRHDSRSEEETSDSLPTLREQIIDLNSQLDAAKRRSVALEEAGEMLWVCLANVDQGNWAYQTEEWQKAAAEWRDRYYKAVRSPNAGSNLLTREQVRPLKEALEKINKHEGNERGFFENAIDQSWRALEYAKTLGL